MLGSSLFFLGRKSPRDVMAAQILALIGLLDALLAFLGYLYGVHGLYAVSHYTTMAVHTALIFVFLCLGVLFARPDRGLISVITSEFSGGQMARLILPLALTLPLFIGWLRLKGENAGLYSTGFGFALFATANVIIFTILIWISAKSLNTRTAELAQSAHRYRFLADAMPQMVWTAKPDGNVDYFNKRWFDYTGMTIEQTKDWGWRPCCTRTISRTALSVGQEQWRPGAIMRLNTGSSAPRTVFIAGTLDAPFRCEMKKARSSSGWAPPPISMTKNGHPTNWKTGSRNARRNSQEQERSCRGCSMRQRMYRSLRRTQRD